MDPKYKDAYRQLDLDSPSASWDEVKISYRRKVQRLHPDRVQEGNQSAANQEEFIRVTRAYKLLKKYHRRNADLPRDNRPPADTAKQPDVGSFDSINYKDLAKVVKSKSHKVQRRHSVLKLVLAGSLFALVIALGLMSFASWQKSQVPPVTPFTTDKPMPLTSPDLIDESDANP